MQFIRFLIIGVLNTAFGLLLIFAAMRWLHLDYRLANTFGYVAGCILSFSLNRIWTFRDEGSWSGSALRWIVVVAVCFGFNLVTVILLHEWWHVDELGAQLGGMAVYTLTSFAGGRLFAFRHPRVADLAAHR